jgi:hypothetical protein
LIVYILKSKQGVEWKGTSAREAARMAVRWKDLGWEPTLMRQVVREGETFWRLVEVTTVSATARRLSSN